MALLSYPQWPGVDGRVSRIAELSFGAGDSFYPEEIIHLS
jgi:hypothetical protein